MKTPIGLARNAAFVCGLFTAFCVTGCAVLQSPAPVRSAAPQKILPPLSAPSSQPERQTGPLTAPMPAPAPVPLPPDYTYLEGHSSRSVPVPVAPVEVESLEPVSGN